MTLNDFLLRVDQETAEEHVGNALQILAAINPMETPPVEAEKLLLAVEARLMKALNQLRDGK